MTAHSGTTVGQRFVFVGGAPRSGTTLVQNMLDSHPAVLGGPEFLHLPDIIELRAKLLSSVRAGWIDEFCSEDEVNRHIGRLITDLLLNLADKHDCDVLSEKTPFNVLIFSELLELFPDARCIHVVRDPRAIVSSMLQVGKRARAKGWQTQDFTTNVGAAIDQVRVCFDKGFEAERLFPDRVLTVVYERLVSEPSSEAERICDFLSLDWSEQMLRPADQKHLGEKAVTKRSAEVWYDQKSYYRNPDSSEVEKWRSLLSPIERTIVNMSFRDHLAIGSQGYDLGPRRSRIVEWAAAVRVSRLRSKSLGAWVRRLLGMARRRLRASLGMKGRG